MQNIDLNESDLGQDQSLTSEVVVVSAGYIRNFYVKINFKIQTCLFI